MRNLKKILALVLALVMSMSLVTIANAADFSDSNDISYEEAVDVMSTIGVINGMDDGSFDPHGTLTREQAAKLVTYMLLGDNAERLGIERSTFKDVAVTRWSAPAIEYCVSLGIIDGAGDGNFYPAGQLTAAAFAKVLLTAIGYNSQKEVLVGSAWSVNVSALAAEVGLDSGIEDLSWSSALTREEAAQMALNAIKAPLVAYEGGTTITVNGAEVSIGSGDAYYITSTLAREQRISEEQLTNSNLYTVEFGERYFPNLRLNQETDEFERPSYTWVYENTELGTYVNYDMLEETYTEGVTGRDLFELLGRSTIDKYELTYYVDGEVNTTITATSMNRGNTSEYSTTGNGVLTQVFIDHDTEEIIITSINTYLAQANADYNENSETLSLNVFESDSEGTTKTVDSADVPNAVDVAEDQFVLVNMSKKDRTRLEVVKISDVEILSDVTVTKFSTADHSAKNPSIFTKLTADGEEYDASQKALYDDDFLNLYDATLLTDMSYNVYLDQYGYAIGVDLYEGEANYVFITGYDRGRSYISIKTAQAGAIFLDGRMEEITVNVTNTNKNIDKADSNRYYAEWNNSGDQAENRWYTYTVDGNNVYTLKPVEDRMLVTDYVRDISANYDVTINSSNVRVEDSYDYNTTGSRVAYGNDDSLYITVEAGAVDMSPAGVHDAIVDVTGLYTGVQSIDMEITDELQEQVTEGSVYTLMDRDQYIIASIVLGEAQGSVSNYAYILTDARSEGIEDGVYQWTFDAVMNGEKVTLTARSQYPNTIDDLDVGTVQELRFDGDYVVSVRDLSSTKFLRDYSIPWSDDYEVYDVDYSGAYTLELQGRTLKSSDANDRGLTITSTSMPTVLRQQVNGSWTTTNYGSMNEALSAVGDNNTNVAGLQFRGTIVAVLNGQGVAQWAFIESLVPVTTGSGTPIGGSGEYYTYTATVFSNGMARVNLTAYRPEWLAYSHTDNGIRYAGVDLDYTYDIMVNGQLYATIDSSTPSDTHNTIDDAGTSASSLWTNWSGGWGMPLDANDKVTVENFQWKNLGSQNYMIKYVDASMNELPADTFSSKYSQTSSGSFQFEISDTKYDDSDPTDTAGVTLIGAYVTDTTGTDYVDIATVGVNKTINGFTTGDYVNGHVPLENYLYVQIDLSKLTLEEATYSVLEGNDLTAAEKAAIGTSSLAPIPVSNYGLTGTDGLTITLKSDAPGYGITGLSQYNVVTFTAKMNACNNAVSYDVVVETSEGTLTFENVTTTGVSDYVTMPAEDVTILDVEVNVHTPKLAIRGASVSGNVMTINFNTGVNNGDTPAGGKLEANDFDDNPASRADDIVGVEHTAGSSTVKITVKNGVFAAGDKIIFDSTVCNAAAQTTDNLGGTVLEVKTAADGSLYVHF